MQLDPLSNLKFLSGALPQGPYVTPRTPDLIEKPFSKNKRIRVSAFFHIHSSLVETWPGWDFMDTLYKYTSSTRSNGNTEPYIYVLGELYIE